MGFFFGGKDDGRYTVQDLVYWSGVIAGIIIVYVSLTPFDVLPVIRFGAGVVAGIGLGWISERLYESLRRPPPGRDNRPDPRDAERRP